MNEFSAHKHHLKKLKLKIKKISLKNSPIARTRRLKMSWFSLGMLGGILLSGGFNLMLEKISQIDFSSKKEVAAALPSKQDENIAMPYQEPTFEPSTPAIPVIQWPQQIDLKVGKGKTLAGILTSQGVSSAEAYNILEAMKKTFNPKKLREGQKLSLILEKDETRESKDAATLSNLSLILNKLETVEVNAKDGAKGEFTVKKIKKKLVTKIARAKGKIGKGQTISGIAARQNTPTNIIGNLIRAYSYDIDFQRDIQVGDSFDILYESLVTDDGTIVKGGDIKYATLKSKGKTLKIYFYEDKNTVGQFYNAKGESIVKKLLRTPVDGARISSKFGMRRHPILGYSKMHTGIDFAAPRGTRVLAAGEGVVTFAGRKGGYGNYLVIRHNSTYSTAYAHLQRYGRGIKKGKKVSQEQIVAYVGSTGRSTGPHLHYEIIKMVKKPTHQE